MRWLRVFAFSLIAILQSSETYAIIIFIRNIQHQTEFKVSGGERIFKSYQVQVGEVVEPYLPHSLGQLSNQDCLKFVFLDFENDQYEVIPDIEFQQKLYQLLINDPNDYIHDDGLLDVVEPDYNQTFRERGFTFVKPTSFQLFRFLLTGENNQSDDSSEVKLEECEPQPSRLLQAGEWVAITRQGQHVHHMMFLWSNIYMSKIGNGEIYFHSLESAIDLYGVESSLFHIWIESMDKLNSKRDDRDPPEGGAGACFCPPTSTF